MIKQIRWPFAILCLFTLGACEKEVDPPPTNTQLLTQSSWKFQSASAAGTDITNNPQFVASFGCIKDDVITFSSSGSGSITEGTNVCSPTTATSTMAWTFQTNETQLSMSHGLFPGGSGLFTIETLSETTLKVSQNITIPPSTTAIPVIAVYVH
jgi:hypothetical protein